MRTNMYPGLKIGHSTMSDMLQNMPWQFKDANAELAIHEHNGVRGLTEVEKAVMQVLAAHPDAPVKPHGGEYIVHHYRDKGDPANPNPAKREPADPVRTALQELATRMGIEESAWQADVRAAASSTPCKGR